MQLHQRGVDLLMNVMEAVDQSDELTPQERRRLLQEVVEVMSQILERDALIALNSLRRYPPQALAAQRSETSTSLSPSAGAFPYASS